MGIPFATVQQDLGGCPWQLMAYATSSDCEGERGGWLPTIRAKLFDRLNALGVPAGRPGSSDRGAEDVRFGSPLAKGVEHMSLRAFLLSVAVGAAIMPTPVSAAS
jgi:hypothetical protein